MSNYVTASFYEVTRTRILNGINVMKMESIFIADIFANQNYLKHL